MYFLLRCSRGPEGFSCRTKRIDFSGRRFERRVPITAKRPKGRHIRAMGLGSLRDFTLTEAREAAREARRLLKTGVDPIDHRKAAKAKKIAEAAQAAAKNVSFKQCAEMYFGFHGNKWRNPKHRQQFMNTLKDYAFPILGNVPVGEISMPMVLKVLQQPVGTPPKSVWEAKTETASRVRGRIEDVIEYGRVSGYRDDGPNPAAWKGNLEHALPAASLIAKKKRHPALPYDQLPAFWAALKDQEGIGARALQFTILSAVRTDAIIKARWSEVDLKTRVWTVPAERTKTHKAPHRVPLSAAAVAVLKSLPRDRDDEWVFVGGKPGTPISNAAMSETIKRMHESETKAGRTGWVDPKQNKRGRYRARHAIEFQRCRETTNFPDIISEIALGHAVGNEVSRAYGRGDMLARRQKLMDAWAAFVIAPPRATDSSNVTALRQGSAA